MSSIDLATEQQSSHLRQGGPIVVSERISISAANNMNERADSRKMADKTSILVVDIRPKVDHSTAPATVARSKVCTKHC